MNELDTEIAKQVFGIEVGGAPYSQEIGAAFQVLTAMREKGWFFRLDSYQKDGFICTMQNIQRKTYSVSAPNAPQAICECAIKAANGEKEKA